MAAYWRVLSLVSGALGTAWDIPHHPLFKILKAQLTCAFSQHGTCSLRSVGQSWIGIWQRSHHQRTREGSNLQRVHNRRLAQGLLWRFCPSRGCLLAPYPFAEKLRPWKLVRIFISIDVDVLVVFRSARASCTTSVRPVPSRPVPR